MGVSEPKRLSLEISACVAVLSGLTDVKSSSCLELAMRMPSLSVMKA